jgi:ABC-type nitrate/sulfonate/bicarbonate transport system substrate-binding protein
VRIPKRPGAVWSVKVAGCRAFASLSLALLLACLSTACGAMPHPSAAKQAAGTPPGSATGGRVSSKGEPVHVTVAYGSPSAAFMPLFVALDDGEFGRYGLDVTAELLGTSAAQDAALTQNQIQFNLAGIPEIDAIRKGLPTVFIASWLNTVVASIVADPGYQSVDQLLHDPRAVIAVNAPPALLNLCWRMLFQAYQVDMGGVRLLNVNAIPATVAALKAR